MASTKPARDEDGNPAPASKGGGATDKDTSPDADGAGSPAAHILSTIDKNVEDPQVRGILKIVVVLALLAAFLSTLFAKTSIIDSLTILATFLCLGIFARLTVEAFKPIGDENSATKIDAADRKQKNARVSLLIAAVGLFAIVLSLDLFLLPIWPILAFEFNYRRLLWGATTLADFPEQKSVLTTQDGVSYLSESDIPLSGPQVTDNKALLRLLIQPPLQIPQGIDLRATHGNEHQVELIAARKVTFDKRSSIQIGSTNLFIITQELEINAPSSDPRDAPQIFAYSQDDIPTNYNLLPGKEGITGESAGNLTIIVTGSLTGSGQLRVDLRGQRGGQGAKGTQPPKKPDKPDQVPLAGRPLWSFRKATELELAKAHQGFIDEVERAKGEPERQAQIEQYEREFRECAVSSGPCKFILCDESNWDIRAAGSDGDAGDPGNQGGKGGAPGKAGVLRIMTPISAPMTDSEIARHFRWTDGKGDDVSSEPPAQLGGPGGPTGDPGLPGLGGAGLPSASVGACQAGQRGLPGGMKETKQPDHLGDSGVPGKSAFFQRMQSLLFTSTR